MIVRKICKYPACKKIAKSTGSALWGRTKRGRWCSYHRDGKGKPERLVYAAGNPVPPTPTGTDSKGAKRLFLGNKRLEHDLHRSAFSEDKNINHEKLAEFRKQSMYGTNS